MRKPVELAHASRLINHGPTVLVTSAHAGRRNVMAAAWSMPVEFKPPRIAIVLDKTTYTSELVLASGRFAVCIPGRALADLTHAVGSVSGRDMTADDQGTPADRKDKFDRFDIGSFDGPEFGLPLIEACVAWMECRLIPETHTQQTYDTCFAEVVSAQADARVFDHGRWSFRDDNADLHTLHHLGGGAFACAGQVVQAAPLG